MGVEGSPHEHRHYVVHRKALERDLSAFLMVYNIDMYSSQDIEAAFGKENHCSMCGDTNFMCDCNRHNVDDYDSMDDEEDDY